MTTTRTQEYEALAKIREIVDGLGANSYIGMAFEGCFEIAESNIRCDFGDSMKQRAEIAEDKVKGMRDQIARMEKELQTKNEKIAELECESTNLSRDDKGSIIFLIRQTIKRLEETISKSEREIIEFADDPTSESFTEAVKEHRRAKTSLESFSGLLQRMTN